MREGYRCAVYTNPDGRHRGQASAIGPQGTVDHGYVRMWSAPRAAIWRAVEVRGLWAQVRHEQDPAGGVRGDPSYPAALPPDPARLVPAAARRGDRLLVHREGVRRDRGGP